MTTTATTPFGQALRHWRRLRGLSQLDLAAAAATTTRYVSFLETGRSRPSRDMVERLADVLAVPLRERNENFEEVVVALADRVAADLLRHPDDPDLQALHAYVVEASDGTGREARGSTRVICPRFRIDGRVVRTLTVAARFESAADVTLDELRVELIYPADPASEHFFRERRSSAG